MHMCYICIIYNIFLIWVRKISKKMPENIVLDNFKYNILFNFYSRNIF